MLRLWPDTLRVGLFHEHSWVIRGGERLSSWTIADDRARSADGLLVGLEQQLASLSIKRRRWPTRRACVLTSDTVAAIVPVPWQDALQGEEEWRAYARSCFQATGRSIEEDWVLHVEFARHGQIGFAYAYPRLWLQNLIGILDTARIPVRSVMPVSACLYASVPAFRDPAPSVVFLHELTQVTAVEMGVHGLLSYDVEPVLADGSDAFMRLSTRQDVSPDASIACWSPSGLELSPIWRGSAMEVLAPEHWGRTQ